MIVKPYYQISSFLDENLAFLEQEEAENNLIIGIIMGLKEREEQLSPKPIMLTVFDEETPLLVGIQTPPKNLILSTSKNIDPKVINILIAYLLVHKIPVPGVIAEKHLATSFAKEWENATHTKWKVVFNQLIYRLDKLENTTYPKGRLRLMTMEEVDLASQWIGSFLEEALNEKNEANAKKMAINNIETKTLYVWENQEAVTMAAVNRPTRHGITVSYVYTPPKFRGKGYASACVSQLSALMLEKYKFCTLYTDLSNPTSNKIYTRIGYQKIQESQMIEFLN